MVYALGVAVGYRVGSWASLLCLDGIHGRALLLERVHTCDLIRLGLVLICSIAYSAAERHHDRLHDFVAKKQTWLEAS